MFFLCLSAQVLANLTRLHAKLLTPPQYDGVKTKQLMVLGALLNHENQKISFIALELWVHLFRHHARAIIKVEFRQSLLGELLKIACVKLVKSTATASAESDADEDDGSVESVEEKNQFFGVYRGAMLQLIALMAEMEVSKSARTFVGSHVTAFVVFRLTGCSRLKRSATFALDCGGIRFMSSDLRRSSIH